MEDALPGLITLIYTLDDAMPAHMWNLSALLLWPNVASRSLPPYAPHVNALHIAVIEHCIHSLPPRAPFSSGLIQVTGSSTDPTYAWMFLPLLAGQQYCGTSGCQTIPADAQGLFAIRMVTNPAGYSNTDGCMDVYSASTSSNAAILTGTCHYQTNQRFYVYGVSAVTQPLHTLAGSCRYVLRWSVRSLMYLVIQVALVGH